MTIKEGDIDYCKTVSSRSGNDEANKKREDIMIQIIEWIALILFGHISQVPGFLFENHDWKNLYDEMKNYLFTNLPEGYNKENIVSLKPKKYGGRKNYDLSIIYEVNCMPDHERDIEFKFNVTQVEDCPQFHSPNEPDRYLISEIPFTKFHYNNYLWMYESFMEINKPPYEEYKKQMKFSNKPNDQFLRESQKKFYGGSKGSSQYTGLEEDIAFYEISKNLSEESFKEYFNICELDHERLTNIWLEKQKNKEYMLLKDGKLHYQKIDEDSYKIVSVEKKCPNFICKTKNGKTLKVLFRWKNGHGIAFPAFQISIKK